MGATGDHSMVESQILRKEMLPTLILLTAVTDFSNKGDKILRLTFDRLTFDYEIYRGG